MFVELLARSHFSFLRGASQPQEVVEQAHQLGLSAIGLCDRDGLYGAVRAWQRARELGLRFIVGAELGCGSGEGRAVGGARRDRSIPAAPAGSPGRSREEPPLVSLLVEDLRGYESLCRLLTRAHAGLPKGQSRLEPEWLCEHNQGLKAIVPVTGTLAREGADEHLVACVREAFGGRAWLGAYRWLDAGGRARHERVVSLARRFDMPVLATTWPLMHHRSRKSLADVLYCIRTGTTLHAAGTRLLPNAEARLRSEAQMERLFRDRTEWVHATGEAAESLRFELSELRYRFPCQLEPGETADEKLARLTWEGAQRRYRAGIPEAVRHQLEKELCLIGKLEMAAYFLSTWEIVEIARRRRILCQGRGSAANSAVCYALGITAVDPARSNLLFERFMSVERHEPPDIDVDFEHERREEVIQEIYERYGRERAAMVSEVICYRGKSALRDVGKSFGLSLERVERLTAAISHWDSAATSQKYLADHGFDPKDAILRQIIELADQLRGFPRHLSIHVGGFVLSARDLNEVAPVEPARMPGRSVIPWDKDDLEALGFFKVDVLGLGMLTALRKTLESIHREGRAAFPADTPFDPIEALARIPAEDPRVYELISRADTVGVFQIESRAQMSMLPRLRPRCFYDLVIEVAIVRPGPIQGGMVHPYLRRRNGQEPVSVPHPELEAILERTLGVPLFQEQVMQISIVGAGYTAGQADQLRRDMAAWKKTGRLLRHREQLLAGFASKGIRPEFGRSLFEQIKGFGEYGFPESHAASFALLVYASAWQKVHYPEHFTCALLNSQPMGFYSPSSLLRDAQRHGVEVRDVDVASSDWDCSLEARSGETRAALRLGLRSIKGLGRATSERIVVAREAGPFATLFDLKGRARLDRGSLEVLAEAGALEGLVPGRRQALWQARAPELEGLFAGRSLGEPEARLPVLHPMMQLELDYERKGFSVQDHPLCYLRKSLKQRGVLSAEQLSTARTGAWVRVAGMVLCRQQPATASGVIFVTLEDESGTVNLIIQRAIAERFRHEVRHAPLLVADGRLERQARDCVQAAVTHVIVRRVEWLVMPSGGLITRSRDFH